MPMSLDEAAEAFRNAMRETIKLHSLWYLAEGVLLVVLGVLLLVVLAVLAIIFPLFASTAAVTLLGWLLIISGVVQAISLIGAGKVPQFWLQLISVVLAVVVGILFLRDPSQALLSVTLLLIVFFMIEGISKIVFALTIRPFPNWGWVLASGILSILLSLILWANLPEVALWKIGLLIGIELIGEGAALGYLAWQFRQA